MKQWYALYVLLCSYVLIEKDVWYKVVLWLFWACFVIDSNWTLGLSVEWLRCDNCHMALMEIKILSYNVP